jgi:AraC-like DNA-binding protein
MLGGKEIHVRKKRKHTAYPMHWHDYFEIIHYRNCKGYCDLNGERHVLTDNCLFLLSPKDFHEIHTEALPDAESTIVSFSEQIADASLLQELTAAPIMLSEVPEGLSDALERLHELFEGEGKHRDAHLKHLLNHILLELLENGRALSGEVPILPPIIRESISYILQDPAQKITLEILATKFNVTKTYYSHLFHDTMGISFKQYVTAFRMDCAKRMLTSGDLSVIDVGFECGYTTPSQFVRAFKSNVGTTPSQYRLQQRRRNGE